MSAEILYESITMCMSKVYKAFKANHDVKFVFQSSGACLVAKEELKTMAVEATKLKNRPVDALVMLLSIIMFIQTIMVLYRSLRVLANFIENHFILSATLLVVGCIAHNLAGY